MTATSILLVEDSVSIARHMIRTLSAKGFAVTHAEDGQAGWEILAAGNSTFEVMVLDREMPRLNGIELLRRIKATPALSQIPVVMVTTLADEKSVREGLAEGAYYYLAKPFLPEVLLSVVAAAGSQYREYRELRASVNQAERPFALMEDGRFRFRSMDDGRALGKSLARGCPEPERAVLGLQELLVNAVEHGNLGIGYQEKSELLMKDAWLQEINRRLDMPDQAGKYVTVRFERTPQSILVTIQDQGQGFDWKKYIAFDTERAFDAHGRGIALARQLSFDDIQYLGNGNTVVVTITLPDK